MDIQGLDATLCPFPQYYRCHRKAQHCRLPRREFEWRVGQGRGLKLGRASARKPSRLRPQLQPAPPDSCSELRGRAALPPPPPALLFEALSCRGHGCAAATQHPRVLSFPLAAAPGSAPSRPWVLTPRTSFPSIHSRSWVVSAGPPLGFALREGLGPRGQSRGIPRTALCLSSLGHKLHRYPIAALSLCLVS